MLLKPHKPEAVEIGRELCHWLMARDVEVLTIGDHLGSECGARAVHEDELVGIDFLVVLGGDGTLLHGAELVADRGVPLLGINLGTLGFLTTCPPEQGLQVLERALAGQLAVERRMRLRVLFTQENGERIQRFACNDVVINQGALARLMEFESFLDGRPITTYRADGLIISTPTGSTAYNLAAGGPIVSPHVQAMILSPICPHTLTNRPLVVPAASRVQVRLGTNAQNVLLTVDGQWGTPFTSGDQVEIHAANQPLLLYRPPEITYFDVLRTKLHWGERNRTEKV
jgi:NAD+ kinase